MSSPADTQRPNDDALPPPIEIELTLNGDPVRTEVMPWDNAVVALERLGIRGAREACGIGMCGCCTITVDGEVVSACLFLAAFLDGTTVETVESLATDNTLHVVQEAFVECSAFQCGFCTPGWIMMTRQLLQDHPEPSDEEITHYLSGNVCRCAAYPDILRAVRRSLGR